MQKQSLLSPKGPTGPGGRREKRLAYLENPRLPRSPQKKVGNCPGVGFPENTECPESVKTLSPLRQKQGTQKGGIRMHG